MTTAAGRKTKYGKQKKRAITTIVKEKPMEMQLNEFRSSKDFRPVHRF